VQPLSYCPVCGTEAVGAFCATCGRRFDQPASAPHAATDLETYDARRAAGLPAPVSSTAVVELPTGDRRRELVLETWFVMIAFLAPAVIGAVLVFSQSYTGVSERRFPTIVHNHLANMFLGMLAYLPLLAVVPIALFLLWRTGQGRQELGLGLPSVTRDVLPGLGLGAAAFGIEVVMLIPFSSLISTHSKLVNTVSIGHFPKYYLIEGIFMSAVTAITEEVLVNGYLNTRLYQLGWSPRASLILSLTLRTSYHIYYGFGFLLTIPLGYFVTRSFQKHHKLNRPIMAHFLYDAILFSISILK
jgi:hypothetical protein